MKSKLILANEQNNGFRNTENNDQMNIALQGRKSIGKEVRF